MTSKRSLARSLSAVAGFEHARVDLEQYATPPETAADIVHLADLRGDIDQRFVFDLGCGTGRLGIAAALRNAARVCGIDVDRAALGIAAANAERLSVADVLALIQGDVLTPPVTAPDEATVLMNPPFGAQHGNRHADRAFLAIAASLGSVSYSVHNEGSRDFVEAFTADRGGNITDAFLATMPLPAQFGFHSADERLIEAEVFRIQW